MRHTLAVYPHIAERLQVLVATGIQYRYQVVPCGVAIGKGREIFVYAFAEGLLAHDLHQFAHHHGRLVVDDVTIDESRIAQVVQLLAYGIRAQCAVLAQCRCRVVLYRVQRMVHLGEQRLGDAGGKVVGKYLLRPHIVKPRHRDIVAKPHVCRLVCDELRARQHLVQCGMLAQEHARVVIQRSTRMLHTAILEARQYDQAILGKGIGDARVLLQPVERRCHLLEYHLQLCHLACIHLTVIGHDGALPIHVLGPLQLAHHEGKQIGAQRFGRLEGDELAPVGHVHRCHLRVRYRLPCLRHLQLQGKLRLQVRLFKTGKHRTCTVGHQ